MGRWDGISPVPVYVRLVAVGGTVGGSFTAVGGVGGLVANLPSNGLFEQLRTPKLTSLLSNAQTAQTASNTPLWSQTGLKQSQTPHMGFGRVWHRFGRGLTRFGGFGGLTPDRPTRGLPHMVFDAV